MLAKKFLSVFVIVFLLLSYIPLSAQDDLIIVLDPGHGSTDNGSSGKLNGKTYYEKDLNNMVTAHLYDSLAQYAGVKVYLTRYDDSKPSLMTRSVTAGKLGADLMISLHMNALDNADYYGGSEIYVHSGNYLPEGAKATKAIATDILKGFEQFGLKNRGVKTKLIDNDKYYMYDNGQYADYYGVIRYATMVRVPAMIIEHGYMSNKSDLEFLSKSENLKKLADKTAEAVAKYYGLEKGEGQKMTMKVQEGLTIGSLPTSMVVGDEISTLTATGGSGSGTIHYETNDKEVLQIQDGKLVAVGEGMANVYAIRDTDGEYQAKMSDNYIRISVSKPISTPTPTIVPTPTPTFTPTPKLTPAITPTPTLNPTTAPTVVATEEYSAPTNTSAQTATTENTENDFWTAIAVIGGILAAFLIVSFVLLMKSKNSNKKSRRR